MIKDCASKCKELKARADKFDDKNLSQDVSCLKLSLENPPYHEMNCYYVDPEKKDFAPECLNLVNRIKIGFCRLGARECDIPLEIFELLRSIRDVLENIDSFRLYPLTTLLKGDRMTFESRLDPETGGTVEIVKGPNYTVQVHPCNVMAFHPRDPEERQFAQPPSLPVQALIKAGAWDSNADDMNEYLSGWVDDLSVHITVTRMGDVTPNI